MKQNDPYYLCGIRPLASLHVAFFIWNIGLCSLTWVQLLVDLVFYNSDLLRLFSQVSLTRLLPTKGDPASLTLAWSLRSISAQSRVETV